MTRTAPLAGLALAALAVSAFAQKDDEKPRKDKDKAKAPAYKTPEACFDAARAAYEKGDFAAFVACIAPDAQKDLASKLGLELVSSRAMVEELKDNDQREAMQKAFGPVNEVLDRHGLTPKATKEIRKGKDGEENEKAKKAVLKLVKDPEKFLADVLAAFDKLSGPNKEKTKDKLTDVKIDGDKATGVIVTTRKGKDDNDVERKEKVQFVKVGGGWRMIPSFGGDGGEKQGDKDKNSKDKDG